LLDVVGESRPDRYKWIALSNTTFATLLATIDGSITLIALPEIFRGIKLDPLDPASSFYLLWMILGFLVVVAVLVLSLGGWAISTGASGCTTSASSSTPSRRSCSRSTG